MAVHSYQKVVFAAVLVAIIFLYTFLTLSPFDTDCTTADLFQTAAARAARSVRLDAAFFPGVNAWGWYGDWNDCVKSRCGVFFFPPASQVDDANMERALQHIPTCSWWITNHQLLFCSIPKNGCSFWKRVFSILNGTNQGSRVFNLSGTAIHKTAAASAAASYQSLSRYRNSIPTLHYLLSTYTKILFVRDPYERLFSGYVDKFFSPGTFAGLHSSIVKEFRGNRTNRRKCQRGVDFTEFLQYVTNQRDIKVNPHFQSQHGFCSPCRIEYDFIGKFETFYQDDADFVLEDLAQLDSVSVWGPPERFEESSDVNIMRDITARTWETPLSYGEECLSPYGRMLRLWITFQVRGFLSIKHKLPLTRQEAVNTSRERFLALVLQAYRQSGNRTIVKLQRQQALQEAFRSVPDWLLQRVERFVARDCRLFGYQCSLPLRFHLDSPKPRPLFHMHEALED